MRRTLAGASNIIKVSWYMSKFRGEKKNYYFKLSNYCLFHNIRICSENLPLIVLNIAHKKKTRNYFKYSKIKMIHMEDLNLERKEKG